MTRERKAHSAAPAQYSGANVQIEGNTYFQENQQKTIDFVEDLPLKLDAIFALTEYRIIKLKGYSKYNNNKVYSVAKQPTGPWKNVKMEIEEMEKWVVEENGWIGLVVPAGFVVLDVDDRTVGDKIAAALANERIEHTAIHTPRGWQFIFKDSAKKIKKQAVEQTTACLAAVDYRVADKGYIVLPTQNTHNRYFTKITNAAAEIPSYFTPITGKNIPHVPIAVGERNDQLFRHAARLYAHSFTPEEVFKIISFINNFFTEEPLSGSEINMIVKKRYEYGEEKENEKEVEYENGIKDIAIEEDRGGYCVTTEDMLATFVIKKSKNSIKYIIKEVICEYFTITAKMITEYDGVQYIELENKKRGRKMIIAADLDSKNLNTFDLTKIMGVIDPNVKKLITKYIRIATFKCKNERKVYKTTGWKSDGKFMHQALRNNNNNWIKTTDVEIPVLLGGKGCVNEQVDMLRTALDHKAGVAVLGAFAAPLIQVLGVHNFVILFASRTRTGKTTANRLALSFFGDPQYMRSANTTVNALEIYANTLKDLPVALDELETLSSGQNSLNSIIQFIYAFTQGVGRQRATTSIRLRETACMRGVLLLSGEKDLKFIAANQKRNTPAGAWNRTIQITDGDLWGDDGEKIAICRELNHKMHKNYGILGAKYINFLENFDKEKIKKMYDVEYKKQIENGADEQSGNIATLLTTLRLLRIFLQNDDALGEKIEQFLQDLGKNLTAKKMQETDIVNVFIENFEGWLMENGNKVIWQNATFAVEKQQKEYEKDEVIAYVNQKNTASVVKITNKAFVHFCNTVIQYPTGQVLQELKKANMLAVNNKNEVVKTAWFGPLGSKRGYTITMLNASI